MKPIDFIEQNKVLQKPQGMTDDQCQPLPIWTDGNQCVSCWRPTWREWLAILFYRRVWISVLSGGTQPPIWMQAKKTVFVKEGT